MPDERSTPEATHDEPQASPGGDGDGRNAGSATLPCPFCGALTRADLALGTPACAGCGRPLLTDRPIAVGDASLEQVLDGTDLPVLVDFYADWCGPCRMMAPVFDEVAHDHAGRAVIAKLDTDRNPLTSARFGIRSIPTLIAFRNGQEVARRIGAVPRAQLERLLDEARISGLG